MEINLLKQDDKSQWQILWQGYLDFYQTNLPQAITDNTWQKIIDENSSVYGFGVWQGDELVAIAHITLHEHTWTTKLCCYLIDLFVSPNARGHGVARTMMAYIYQFAKEQNCERVYWVTKEDNVQARALYDKVATKTDFIQYRYTF